jgi:nitrate reductase cytochrome c-type subunit
MKIVLHCCATLSLALFLALPAIVCADEPENYDKDAQQAENTPPMIPHRIKDTSDGEYCLDCHRTGVKGAPQTPHPERLSCTGCHALGEIKDTKATKRSKKK